jgi:Ca2+-binding EF-hand superfamily protein
MQEFDEDESGAVNFMEFKKLVKAIVGTMRS